MPHDNPALWTVNDLMDMFTKQELQEAVAQMASRLRRAKMEKKMQDASAEEAKRAAVSTAATLARERLLRVNAAKEEWARKWLRMRHRAALSAMEQRGA